MLEEIRGTTDSRPRVVYGGFVQEDAAEAEIFPKLRTGDSGFFSKRASPSCTNYFTKRKKSNTIWQPHSTPGGPTPPIVANP